ncbi:MAG: SCP2 sterol-binding domain-containing protein [Deltaproteobacteria bacterium]
MTTPGEFFVAFEEAARANPVAATQPDAVFKFVLSGEDGGTWTLNLKKGTHSAFVSTGDSPPEDATIHVASDDWVALTTGEMNPMRAFMSGKIRVDGDLKLAVNLPNVVNMVEGYGIGARGPISATIAAARGALSAITRKRPAVNPMPPVVPGSLPWVGAGRALVRDPTEFFSTCRERFGDTFLVDAFGYRLFCVFSPAGVRNLWRLPEEEASKALADLTLLSHKVPIELFEGRRTLPHDLFARDDVEVYLDHLREAVDVELSSLGESGSIELFAFTKRLAHRMGLASWGGMAGVSAERLEALAVHFEQLDGSESFVYPRKALLAVATGKRRERRAMHAIEAIFADILREHDHRADANSSDLFSRICASWDGVPSPAREVGIARDVIVVQMGSQSNLFAAMAWTLIFALRHPTIVDQIRAEGDGVLDAFSHEAIRMSQRSIVLRRTVTSVEIADEERTYRVEPGALIATMLSVTNQSAADGLDEFNEKNYRGATFLREKDLPARELVTTYGHGKHTCPAHRFSTSAIRHSVGEIFRRFELTAQFDEPRPLRRQIGGVARADRPCVVRYAART